MTAILRFSLFFALAVSFAAERVPIGLTGGSTTIDAFVVMASGVSAPKVIVVGDPKAVRQEISKYDELAENRRKFDAAGILAPAGVKLVFPPPGVAYRDNPESHYIWRWILTQAPDLVLIAGEDSSGLAQALTGHGIPARSGGLRTIKGAPEESAAHAEIKRRQSRSPRAVAESLAKVYGREMPELHYIPAVALMARLRLGEVAGVEQVAAPFRESGNSLPAKLTEPNLAGHLLFAELAQATGDDRYGALVRAAAEVAAAGGLDNEMSDSVFMSVPLLAKAGKFEAAAQHLARIQKLCLRADGLYRHSPLAEVAWGRGNAFPALGAALALSEIPKEHTVFEEMLRSFQNHMSALARNQDENGMWRQVVDRPGSYSELSATAMIATAMLRGMRAGWLDERAYGPRIERAWRAVSSRTADDGVLIDVCEGTGKQKSLDDYLRRAAIFGRDARGGAMVMLFATEMAGLR